MGNELNDYAGSPKHFKTYTDFSNDIDLVSEGGALGPARWIDVPSSKKGDLFVHNLRGDTEQLFEHSGDVRHIGQVKKILKATSGTTCTGCTVYW